ncbi:hypothetical protein LNV23_12170 [Paucibacter sp. DJ1R-11]|uniref:sensor histidine kinase n=1 Tax=Paucibacter sp. DJ1R-11 TaxID=2893556 RepID=UPI0021E4A4AB|nr:ATP-binding protein [Paucibacter sp. DJ1R-11]MCV2364200.1 hypothetical protein [Paucibacter sp. DJ1R-11]
MVVLQRSLDKSVQHTLRLLLLMLASLIVLAVGSTVLATQYLSGRLSTVYDDRLVPLDDLQTMARILSVEVPVLLQDRVPEQQRAALSAQWEAVQLLWAKYRITYLTEKEGELARNFEAALPRLYRQVLEVPRLPLAADYRSLLAPVLAQLHALTELQLDVAKEELDRARRAAWLATVGGLALAGLGVALVLLAMRIMADNIVRPLGLIATAVAGLARGDSEGSRPELQHMSGDFAEVGEQLRHLRVFMAERQQLLAQEQQGRRRLQEAQDELVESEKLASLGALVAGVAHELNTPLGVAVAVSSGLGDKLRRFEAELAAGPLRRSMLDGLLADLHEATPLMERNLARAAEMVRSFKQVAVDRSGMQRRCFDLAGMVDELLASLRPVYGRQGRELLNALPAGLVLDSYPGALGQVLSNLIANAVLHGLQEGPGRVSLYLLSSGESAVELCISDDGVGMNPEVQARAFDPFFTTRMGQGGSGLGLPIVRNLVMGVLGGRIRLTSSPGAGTRVLLSLPRNAPQQPDSRPAVSALLPTPLAHSLPGSLHVADPSLL